MMAILTVLCCAAMTAEPITVELAGGRVLKGAVDGRTDAASLWLRAEREGAVLRRPIAWDRVVKARVAGQELTGGEFRALVGRVRQEQPAAEAEPAVRRIELQGRVEREPVRAAVASQPAVPARRVQTLSLDVAAANWDADVEVDGLLVRVYPLDASGTIVPVDGTLEVELVGRQTGVSPPPQPFARLGHWAQRVAESDFGADGAVYRLPFAEAHPEFDLWVAARGAALARLSVPGQGTFAAAADSVRIRPYSAVRDQWQQRSGRRFFPQETTGDGRR